MVRPEDDTGNGHVPGEKLVKESWTVARLLPPRTPPRLASIGRVITFQLPRLARRWPRNSYGVQFGSRHFNISFMCVYLMSTFLVSSFWVIRSLLIIHFILVIKP